jgi:hypothetical protein
VNVGKAQGQSKAIREKLNQLAADLGTKYTLRLSLRPAESAKLGWFDGGSRRQPARPVFLVNATATAEMRAAISQRLTTDYRATGRFNVLVALNAGAQALRGTWVNRLSTSGGDIAWAALSPPYAARKRRRGLDPRIGVATGRMLAAVKGGQLVIKKV